MQNVVVIGSNCFTGCHVVDALLADPKKRVFGVSRSPEYKPLFLPYKSRVNSNFSFHQIDLVRRFDDLVALLDKERPELVINVAALSEVALSNERPIEYFDTNTVGVVKLGNHLRRCGYLKRYIHISSAEVYGTCEKPVTEERPFNPSTPYAVSKAAGDQYLTTLHKNFGFPVTAIRSTNVYGKHQQLFKIIPRTAIYLRMKRKIELHGGGAAIKSFVHIRDVVDGILRVIAKENPEPVYHFSTNEDRTVAEIVSLVCETMGHDPKQVAVAVGERLGQDARYWLDWGKARRELDWSPRISLEQGVKEVISWVHENWAQIECEPLEYIHKA